MKKRVKFLVCIYVYCCFPIYSQTERNIIFDSLKTYTYEAVFVGRDGIKTVEKIILKPLGIPWKYQKSQSEYVVEYFPSDSILNLIVDPTCKSSDTRYVKKSTRSSSGAVENNDFIWFHPFRSNQYIYTEVAPFPEVKFDSLIVGKSWHSGKIYILSGWGKFKGNLSSQYYVIGNKKIEFRGEIIDNCWEIKGIGEHNKLGKSSVKYLFHEKYGFLELNYQFFDGTLIEFKLTDIIQ